MNVSWWRFRTMCHGSGSFDRPFWERVFGIYLCCNAISGLCSLVCWVHFVTFVFVSPSLVVSVYVSVSLLALLCVLEGSLRFFSFSVHISHLVFHSIFPLPSCAFPLPQCLVSLNCFLVSLFVSPPFVFPVCLVSMWVSSSRPQSLNQKFGAETRGRDCAELAAGSGCCGWILSWGLSRLFLGTGMGGGTGQTPSITTRETGTGAGKGSGPGHPHPRSRRRRGS